MWQGTSRRTCLSTYCVLGTVIHDSLRVPELILKTDSPGRCYMTLLEMKKQRLRKVRYLLRVCCEQVVDLKLDSVGLWSPRSSYSIGSWTCSVAWSSVFVWWGPGGFHVFGVETGQWPLSPNPSQIS